MVQEPSYSWCITYNSWCNFGFVVHKSRWININTASSNFTNEDKVGINVPTTNSTNEIDAFTSSIVFLLAKKYAISTTTPEDLNPNIEIMKIGKNSGEVMDLFLFKSFTLVHWITFEWCNHEHCAHENIAED